MSTDKRQVTTDALETLGTIIDERAGRDAIHLAVEPVIAGEFLYPGDHVGLVDGEAFKTTQGGHVGIVDPFLARGAKPGQRFWLVVYPRQITSLRHVWTHPAFDEPTTNIVAIAPKTTDADREASEAWLREFIDRSDCPDYNAVMAAVVKPGEHLDLEGYRGHILDDECLFFGDRDAHGEIPDEFWSHVEIVTGLKPPHRPTYFSCSC